MPAGLKTRTTTVICARRLPWRSSVWRSGRLDRTDRARILREPGQVGHRSLEVWPASGRRRNRSACPAIASRSRDAAGFARYTSSVKDSLCVHWNHRIGPRRRRLERGRRCRAAGATAPASKADWQISATLLEACSCTVSCPCNFGGKPSHDPCQGNRMITINKGHAGDVDLAGVSFMISWDLTSWSKIYISDTATDAQEKALVSTCCPRRGDSSAAAMCRS